MFTVKWVDHALETQTLIGADSVEFQGDTLICHDGEEATVLGITEGRVAPPMPSGACEFSAYVMNQHGATVATYHI